MAVSNSTDRFNAVLAAFAIKIPCHAVALVDITLSGEQTVNSIAVVSGDRVLVTNQDSSIDNGIYDVDTSAWSRAADFDGNRDVLRGTLVSVNTTSGFRDVYEQTEIEPGECLVEAGHKVKSQNFLVPLSSMLYGLPIHNELVSI